MNKKKIIDQINSCITPWDDGGYYDYMHPHYRIRKIADWKLNVKNPLNKGDFWIAAIGDLSDKNKENAKELVKFLGNYKIRIAGGKEGRALGYNELLAIKEEGMDSAEVFWQFGNGTNGVDNDCIPAMKECMKIINDARKQSFIKDAYLLSSSSNPMNDTYSWYIKFYI